MNKSEWWNEFGKKDEVGKGDWLMSRRKEIHTVLTGFRRIVCKRQKCKPWHPYNWVFQRISYYLMFQLMQRPESIWFIACALCMHSLSQYIGDI